MAQVKLLKISTDGLPQEFDSASDDITLASFTVQGGGPVLGATGLDLNNTNLSDIDVMSFNDPTAASITLTAGTFIPDDLMFESKENSLDVGAAVLFPVISDAVGEVDAFRLPALAGAPTATPADGGEGYLVWDSTNDRLYAWNGSAWDDLSTVESAERIANIYTAGENLTAVDAVYISASNTVSKADAATNYQMIGFAESTVLSAASVPVISEGVLGGFTGLTAGSRYYLSTTGGAISTTVPTGAGNNVVQVGYAKSATELQIQIQFIGRRAA